MLQVRKARTRSTFVSTIFELESNSFSLFILRVLGDLVCSDCGHVRIANDLSMRDGMTVKHKRDFSLPCLEKWGACVDLEV